MFKENLDARYYTDSGIYRQEQTGIFNTSWQLVAPRSHFVEKGDYVATEIAGTKVFVVLDEDGQLCGFETSAVIAGQCCLNQGRAVAGRFAVPTITGFTDSMAHWKERPGLPKTNPCR